MNTSRWFFVPGDHVDPDGGKPRLEYLVAIEREYYPLMRALGWKPIAGRQWNAETQMYEKLDSPQAAESDK